MRWAARTHAWRFYTYEWRGNPLQWKINNDFNIIISEFSVFLINHHPFNDFWGVEWEGSIKRKSSLNSSLKFSIGLGKVLCLNMLLQLHVTDFCCSCFLFCLYITSYAIFFFSFFFILLEIPKFKIWNLYYNIVKWFEINPQKNCNGSRKKGWVLFFFLREKKTRTL